MPLLVIDAGELTGKLREGAESRVLASLPAGHAGGDHLIIEAVHVYYRLESPAPGVIPNIDPWRGYETEEPEAPRSVSRTHEDFGPRLPKSHADEASPHHPDSLDPAGGC